MTNKEKTIEITDEVKNQIEMLIHKKIEIWFEHVLFTGLWWMGVGLSTIPWVLWFIFRKKESTDRLLYAGFYVMTISLILDVLGDQLGFWHYRFNVMPILPTYFPWDITLMPVAILFLLQVKPNINPWIKAVFFALITSYLAEPFFHWIDVYAPMAWKYTYSVPIQIFIYMTAHYLSSRNQFAPLKKT
ncbi:CBO0543 family protein [Bacillus sp. MRMR6]|uniref:CBO0543 family protein n=1 Tax=Bacillus sp. MRMR6 TaxID=1928617 RepID=UPI00095316A2|nr:CBO0543 family protein [Bacillus sp. MRMR6]OLS41132.1 hypothetical protein BTR25_04525 [Bacillus sp. MRMR6]